jgi:hypothetical protein
MYRPLRVFFVLGAAFMLVAVGIGLRFLWLWLNDQGRGNVQSLILAAILSIVGFQTMALGLLADLLAANRKLMEETLYRVRRRDAALTPTTSVTRLPGVRVRQDRPGGG